MNFKIYKSLRESEENNQKTVSDALKWLENKYGKDTFTFKNIPNMSMDGTKTKTYDIHINGEEYTLNLRKFDSNGDGELDTVGFDCIPLSSPPEEEDKEIEL